MVEITLEKIDIVRERTGVSYTEAKEALENSEGNVVDALIYLEKNKKSAMDEIYTSKDEFISWLKDVIKKGNINRVKIKKDDKVIVDIPVNAGVAVTLAALVWPPLVALGLVTAVFTKVTVEITRDDGSVEIVNKIIKNTAEDVKDKVYDAAQNIKEKFNNQKENEESAYKYTVNFEEIDDDNNQEDNSCNKDDDNK